MREMLISSLRAANDETRDEDYPWLSHVIPLVPIRFELEIRSSKLRIKRVKQLCCFSKFTLILLEKDNEEFMNSD